MAFEQNDIDVFQLLRKLKDANGEYPQELLASRRQGYLKQVAGITGGVGLAGALKSTAKAGGKAVGLPPAAGTLLESLLVVAIVAEAGTVTYLYRDKIKEAFQSLTNSPKVEHITNPPVISSSSPVPGLEISLSLTPVADETSTETSTPEATPSLLAEQPKNGASSESSSAAPGSGDQAVSTPAAPKDNNGNHYGQTPKPQRTKEPGNNNQTPTDPKKKKK